MARTLLFDHVLYTSNLLNCHITVQFDGALVHVWQLIMHNRSLSDSHAYLTRNSSQDCRFDPSVMQSTSPFTYILVWIFPLYNTKLLPKHGHTIPRVMIVLSTQLAPAWCDCSTFTNNADNSALITCYINYFFADIGTLILLMT